MNGIKAIKTARCNRTAILIEKSKKQSEQSISNPLCMISSPRTYQPIKNMSTLLKSIQYHILKSKILIFERFS